MAGRNALIVRTQRKQKSIPSKKYNRLKPKHNNLIKSWLSANHPEWLFNDRYINKDLRARLLDIGMPV